METPDDTRRLLGSFLRAKRESVMADAQTTALSRTRRTPGLRREEVAQRAGISVTWYTWLEQGRDMALSAAALARLAQTLALSAAERSYLFELAQRRDPEPPATDTTSAWLPDLQRAMATMAMPAYVLDRGWHLRAWNAPAGELFAAWLASGESCLLRYVFLHASARKLICDWEDRAHRLTAEFRADTALHPGDPQLLHTIAMLQQDSAEFARYWHEHGVLSREGGRRAFNHPRRGRVLLAQVTLMPAGHPDHKLVLLPDEQHLAATATADVDVMHAAH